MVEYQPYTGYWTSIETSVNGHRPRTIYIPFSETELSKMQNVRALHENLKPDAMKEGGNAYSLYTEGTPPWGTTLEDRDTAVQRLKTLYGIYREALTEPGCCGLYENTITEIVKNLSYFFPQTKGSNL